MTDIDAIGPGPFRVRARRQLHEDTPSSWIVENANRCAVGSETCDEQAATALANILNREWDRVHPPADRRCWTCGWFGIPVNPVFHICMAHESKAKTPKDCFMVAEDSGTDCPVWKRKEKT